MNVHDDTTPHGLARWGEWCARHPWRVIMMWIVSLAVLAGVSSSMHATFNDNVTLSGTQSASGLTLIAQDFPHAAASTGLVVFSSSQPLRQQRSTLTQVVHALATVPQVISASDPFTSSDVAGNGLVAYSTLGFDVASRGLPTSIVAALNHAVGSARTAGITVNYGGGLSQVTQPVLNDRTSEEVGFAIALIVLLLVFGSVVGAFLPLLTALIGIGAGLCVLYIVGASTIFSASAPKLAIMIGLGVGIDYAVFLTTRFRQGIKDGVDPVTAAGLTTRSSGRAVLVAAATVSIAMLGLYASGLVFVGKLGLAAVFTVLSAAVGAVTLVPALLGLFGRRIDRVKVRTTVAETGATGDGWHRYASAIGRHPWTYLIGGLVILVAFAAPMVSLQLGHVGDGASPSTYTSRQAYDEMATGFGPGANGLFTVLVHLPSATTSVGDLESRLRTSLTSTSDVAHLSSFVRSPNGLLLSATLVPASGPQSAASTTLFEQLVNTTLPRALAGTGDQGYVTGETPSQITFDQLIAQRIPLIIAVVVVMAFLLIMTVFRSLLLALKAAILNLFSIAAAYGVLVAVFQWGWGRSLLGLSENVPIEAYVPMVLFAIVFGLSMDYEIFLLSRVKETWELTHDNHESVADGLARTGRVITAAALIMVSVFLSFVTTDLVAIKQLAVGLAASVAIDATLIRLLLVPATMYLFGDWNWWLPTPLERFLPHLTVD